MIATHYPRNYRFWPVYPEKKHVRVCFLVNKKIPSHSWNVNFIVENLAMLIMQNENGILNVINIYSPPPGSYISINNSSPIH